jgi:hypothetical protein
MSAALPTPEAAALSVAVTALEARDWIHGVSLLVAVLDDIDGFELPRVESTARALLAQALHEMGQPDEGEVQARAALAAAERTDDRALIHRNMALVETFALLARGSL